MTIAWFRWMAFGAGALVAMFILAEPQPVIIEGVEWHAPVRVNMVVCQADGYDTGRIDAAVQHAASYGGEVEIGRGTCLLSRPIKARPGIIISGSGIGNTIVGNRFQDDGGAN